LSKSGSIAATVFTLFIVTPCYATEKIVLTCSGAVDSSVVGRYQDDEGIIIDLDAGFMTWKSDTFPIVSEGNIVRFQKKEWPKQPNEEIPPWTEGSLDRVTGEFDATYDWGSAKKPAEDTYHLTCKPAKPLF